LGRVIWFFVVFFASMDTFLKENKETRKSYHIERPLALPSRRRPGRLTCSPG
jgi:hypothetical protein